MLRFQRPRLSGSAGAIICSTSPPVEYVRATGWPSAQRLQHHQPQLL